MPDNTADTATNIALFARSCTLPGSCCRIYGCGDPMWTGELLMLTALTGLALLSVLYMLLKLRIRTRTGAQAID